MSDLEPSRQDSHVPGPSLWPVGLALGIVVLLVGFAMAWWVVAVGVVVVFVFGLLWARDIAAEKGLREETAQPEPADGDGAPAVEAAPAHEATSYTREKFLEATTLGLGGVIGALVTVPVLGFTVLPSFLHQGRKELDLGPLAPLPGGRVADRDAADEARGGRRLPHHRLRPLQRRRHAPGDEEGRAELHDPLEPLRAPRLPGAAERPARRGGEVPAT